MPTKQRVASLSDIPEGEKLRVEAGGHEIALFRVDGRVYALEDLCPHQGAALSDVGVIRGCQVLCVLHGALFDLETGASQGPPSPEDVATYPVVVEGEEIFVELP